MKGYFFFKAKCLPGKKSLNPANRLAICWPWCSSGIWGDLGVKLNPNNFFFITAGDIQPYGGGWPPTRMREWELDPGTGESTVASLFLTDGWSVSHSPDLKGFVFFVPTQNRQNALNHFSFWPKKQFPTSPTLNNRALILIGGSGCYCNANTWSGWPLRFWHISGTV